jgi:hypothetical protein
VIKVQSQRVLSKVLKKTLEQDLKVQQGGKALKNKDREKKQ